MLKKYKTLLIISIIALMICAIPMISNGADVSYASDDNYEVLYPVMNKYLYLDDPSLTAINGDVVAVYDKGLNKIFTAGAEHNEYDVVLSSDDGEYLSGITFANGTLYYLTNQNKLHDVFNNVDVDLGSRIAINMCSYNNKLYLYNSLISVYEYDGTNFTEYFDKGFKILSSKCFTSTDSKGFFYKDNTIYTLDYSLGTTTKVAYEEDVDAMFILNNKLYVMNEDFIECIDTEVTTLFFEVLGDISTDGTSVAVLLTDSKCIVSLNKDFEAQDLYGCASSEDYWFNNPVSVVSYENTISVYDKNNMRIEIFNDNCVKNVTLTADYDIFTANKDYIVLAKENSISVINNDEQTDINLGFPIGALSISENILYVYDSSSRTIFYGETTDNIALNRFSYVSTDISNIVAVDNNILYTKSNNSIISISPIGRGDYLEIENTLISFDVDFVGNIITLEKWDNDYYTVVYKKSFTGFTKDTATKLQGFADEMTSFSLNGKTAYSVDPIKNLLLKIDNIDAVTADTYSEPTNPDVKGYNSVTFARSTTGTVVYKYNNNFKNTVDIIDAGAVYAIMEEFDNCYYVLTENGKTGYISKTNSQTLTPSTLSGKVIALFDTVGIYNIPSTELAKVTTYNKDTVFTLIDDSASFKLNGNWVKVSFVEGNETKYGYALKTRLMTYTEPEKTEETKVTVKAKSSRVGEQVKGYAMADTSSTEVFSVTDGTKLTVVGDFNENSTFTLVEYNGVQGYVLTENLQTSKGLTGGQIAAITISVITVAITALYIIISRRRKKLNIN